MLRDVRKARWQVDPVKQVHLQRVEIAFRGRQMLVEKAARDDRTSFFSPRRKLERLDQQIALEKSKIRWQLSQGKKVLITVTNSDYERLWRNQQSHPVVVCDSDGTRFWWYQEGFYCTDEPLGAKDVQALVHQKRDRKQRQLEKAHALDAMEQRIAEGHLRVAIPREVKLFVWQRDRGQCVQCGSTRDLHFDHIIPVSMGGSSTERNLQLLCESCNLRKGASLH